jgi:hypothetical protein
MLIVRLGFLPGETVLVSDYYAVTRENKITYT